MIEEKRFGARVVYQAPDALFLDVHPHTLVGQPGAVFRRIVPPAPGDGGPGHGWQVETWQVVEGDVLFIHASPLSAKQRAWVARHFPQFWPTD